MSQVYGGTSEIIVPAFGVIVPEQIENVQTCLSRFVDYIKQQIRVQRIVLHNAPHTVMQGQMRQNENRTGIRFLDFFVQIGFQMGCRISDSFPFRAAPHIIVFVKDIDSEFRSSIVPDTVVCSGRRQTGGIRRIVIALNKIQVIRIHGKGLQNRFRQQSQSRIGIVKIKIIVSAEKGAVGTVISGFPENIQKHLHMSGGCFMTIPMLKIGTGEKHQRIVLNFRLTRSQRHRTQCRKNGRNPTENFHKTAPSGEFFQDSVNGRVSISACRRPRTALKRGSSRILSSQRGSNSSNPAYSGSK